MGVPDFCSMQSALASVCASVARPSHRMLSSCTATRHANLAGQVHMLVGALGPVHVGLVTRMLDANSIVVVPAVLSLKV